jgi:hypothetical protein
MPEYRARHRAGKAFRNAQIVLDQRFSIDRFQNVHFKYPLGFDHLPTRQPVEIPESHHATPVIQS